MLDRLVNEVLVFVPQNRGLRTKQCRLNRIGPDLGKAMLDEAPFLEDMASEPLVGHWNERLGAAQQPQIGAQAYAANGVRRTRQSLSQTGGALRE